MNSNVYKDDFCSVFIVICYLTLQGNIQFEVKTNNEMKINSVVFVICAILIVVQSSPFPEESDEIGIDYDYPTTIAEDDSTTIPPSSSSPATTTAPDTTTLATTTPAPTTTPRPRPSRPTFPRPPRPLLAIATAISTTFGTLSEVVQAAGNYAVVALGQLSETKSSPDEIDFKKMQSPNFEPPLQDPIPDSLGNGIYIRYST